MNDDTNGVHAPGNGKTSTPVCQDMRPGKPGEPRSGKPNNIIEVSSHHYSMEQKRSTTVEITSDTTIGDKTVASSTILESTVHGPNDTAVSDNTVPENILIMHSNASQPKSAKIMEDDSKAL